MKQKPAVRTVDLGRRSLNCPEEKLQMSLTVSRLQLSLHVFLVTATDLRISRNKNKDNDQVFSNQHPSYRKLSFS